jgi:hypothetical protein
MTEIRFSLLASDGEHCPEDARRLYPGVDKFRPLAVH